MTLPQGPILVVEDVTHIRELLGVTLRFKGYPVISARNGQEALDKIAVQRPALVISDILMPKLDGFALAQKIRSDPTTKDLPIVFLSATYVTPEDRAFAMRLGAVHFMEKPVDTEEFLLTIGEIISQGVPSLPDPMDDPSFYQEYRARLEDKLEHKQNQISRINALIDDLPMGQRPTFEELLTEVQAHRDQIQFELESIYRILGGFEERK